MFSVHTTREIYLKTQQSSVILDLCLKKTRSGKLHEYRDAIVSEKRRFKNVSVHTETKSRCFSSHLKSVEELGKEATVGRRNKAVVSNFSDTVWTLHLKLALVRNNTFSR